MSLYSLPEHVLEEVRFYVRHAQPAAPAATPARGDDAD